MRIFISYHEPKVKKLAGAVKASLDSAFPTGKVYDFLDKDDGTLAGEWWKRRVWKELLATDFFVFLIDDEWLTRLKGDEGWMVRLETEMAIIRQSEAQLFFVSVTSGDESDTVMSSSMPLLDGLPESLRDIQGVHWFPGGRSITGSDSALAQRIRTARRDNLSNKRLPVLFVGSSFSDAKDQEYLDYFGLIVSEMVRAFGASDLSIECVVKFPDPKDPVASQNKFLRDAARHWDFYRAVLIAPYETKETWKVIRGQPEFVDNIVPIFTIDKSYGKCASDDGVQAPLGVMNNWIQGGELLGDCAALHFEMLKDAGQMLTPPRVLICEGLEGSEERVKGFRKTLSTDFPDCEWLGTFQGRFQRVEAMRQTERQLKRFQPGEVHLIFCANDEMALGAVEAIQEWEVRSGLNPGGSGAVVVGYDGIESLKTQMAAPGNVHILNSIDVRIKKQVTELSRIVVGYLLNGDSNPEYRILQTDGELCRGLNAQRPFSRDLAARMKNTRTKASTVFAKGVSKK